jgi:hypothetical protein
MVTRRCIAIAAFAAIGLSGAALAQPKQSGLVNVDLSNLRADIAKDINVNARRIPASVEVPVDVAATVCGIEVNALARQAVGATPTCPAKNESQALNQQVQRQLISRDKA